MFKAIANFRKAARGEKGFTLIELLVTVTIIGVLSAVVSVGVGGSQTTAQNKANIAIFNQVQASVDGYVAANNTLTTTTCGATPVAACLNNAGTTNANGTYYDVTGVAAASAQGVTADFYFAFSGAPGSTTNPTSMRLNGTTVTCVFTGTTATSATTVKGCKNA